MRIALPDVLSANAGYVDTAGFLALNGLFTSHVTGNFVTLGSSLVFGTSGTVTKVLALPVFCLTVFLVRLLGQRLQSAGRPALQALLTLQFVLLLAGAACAIGLGPFPNADRLPALLTGLIMVAAMATQNATHRLHLPGTPPSTVMTLTTTQIMLDVAELVQGTPSESQAAVRGRLKRLTLSVTLFALGCAAAALVYARFGVWCFLLPPVLGFTATRLRLE
ncbi:MAG TPA: YoaK family protein [Steroidobacteraceae bacterium]|jgi:uncharacterized membrane protein YoaK (UPF0700 family)|nr:YoaK family protein [Steroidobacteraceae bacterium]